MACYKRGTRAPAAAAISALLLLITCVSARTEAGGCAARARLHSGAVCGARRLAVDGTEFVSFLGVPYAKQPLADLRFKELQPVEPWKYELDATREGPVCPQRDVFYGRIMQPENTALTEACIHANIHVPIHALPAPSQARPPRDLQPPYNSGFEDKEEAPQGLLPIFVFIHGGGFTFGSGDTDLHGPEFLVSKGVIVITFNYRLNVFGFLSLNNSYIPGNNGLRDMVTFLRWVQTNARAFGGDPDDVTLGGHSAGASSAHLLSLSEAAKGLFKRVLIMSGTALPTYYTTSPVYAQFVSNMFLTQLGINSTNPDEVHRQLVEMPLEKMMQVHNLIQDQFGLTVFFPVVETPFPNFTTILTEDPRILLEKGNGKDIPLMVGFTNAECYGFLPRFEEIDILERIKQNPIILVSPNLIYTRPPKVVMNIARRIQARYFGGESTMDQYMKLCSDSNFIYGAMKTAQIRAELYGAPVYLYEFSYESDFSIKKVVDKANYTGAGHLEDLTYVFRVNSVLGPVNSFKPTKNDEAINNWMVHFVMNFIKCSDPACNRERPLSFATPWPAFSTIDQRYQGISMPVYRTLELNSQQLDMVHFFDSLENRNS